MTTPALKSPALKSPAPPAPAPGRDTSRWHGIRIARHEPDHRELITTAVGPFLQEIEPLVRRAYHLPHWRRGPHIRIHVDCTDRDFDQHVLPAAERIIGGYLSGHPNGAAMDPAALLDQHRQLARMEEEAGPLTPWYPDDSVAAEDFDDRAAALGSRAAAELLADCYTAATPLALRMSALSDRRALFATAFDLLVRTAQVGTPAGLSRGFLAFRSHAEAYLTMAADGPALRTAWERQYSGAADQLTRRARRVLGLDRRHPHDQRGDASAGPTPADAWGAVLTGLADRIAELATTGAIRLADPAADGGALTAVAAVSPFHHSLQQQDWWRSGVTRADWFKAYRVMLNFCYLQLTRVGITPVQRFLLCYLASRCAEDLYGTSAQELITSGPTSQEAR